MLRSNTYFQVFDCYLHEFKWNGPCNTQDIFNDRNAKSTIETALLTLRDKFLNATSSPDLYLDRYYVEELFSDGVVPHLELGLAPRAPPDAHVWPAFLS